MQDLYKVVIALVALLIGSWSVFGYFVIKWVTGTDDNVRELYRRADKNTNDITKIAAKCEERHK